MKLNRILSFAASLALVPFIFNSCEDKNTEPEAPKDEKITLEVTPSSAISFKAKQNEDVVLTVKTNAETWAFTAPEWIIATKEENTLKVNAKDNETKEENIGRIEITAGSVKKTISVMQAALSDDTPSAEAGEGVLTDKEGKNTISLRLKKENPTHKAELIVKLGEAAKSEIKVKVKLDPDFLNEYNHTNGTNFVSLPSEAINLGDATIVIPQGQTQSEPLEINLDLNNQAASTNFLATVAVDESSLPEGLKFPIASKRFNIVVMKELTKKIKNLVMLEVNNTNPLNILEYKLEDGTPFFDVVVVFAANINYIASTDRVVLHNNPNVQALLKENQVYLQPLREAGIKVQLGLLPNHTPAGFINLSDEGAKMFATQVVKTIKDNNLDGVLIDEEYVEGFAENSPLLTPYKNGMRLVYELYTQMKSEISWETEISVFDYNWEGYKAYKGKTPGEMISQIVPNYNNSVVSSEWEGVQNSQKAELSIECNRGYGLADMTVERAKQMVSNGYGWCMWYAFHPQNGGGMDNNAYKVDPAINRAAEGFYGLKLATPKYYYEKIGEGKFSPDKKDRDF